MVEISSSFFWVSALERLLSQRGSSITEEPMGFLSVRFLVTLLDGVLAATRRNAWRATVADVSRFLAWAYTSWLNAYSAKICPASSSSSIASVKNWKENLVTRTGMRKVTCLKGRTPAHYQNDFLLLKVFNLGNLLGEGSGEDDILVLHLVVGLEQAGGRQ